MQFEITFGKGDKATTKVVGFDPEDITLGFLEDMEAAQETRSWTSILSAVRELLGLTPEESRQITMRQFKQLAESMQQAASDQSAIPNE